MMVSQKYLFKILICANPLDLRAVLKKIITSETPLINLLFTKHYPAKELKNGTALPIA
jgi:hypothetical protein